MSPLLTGVLVFAVLNLFAALALALVHGGTRVPMPPLNGPAAVMVPRQRGRKVR